MIFCLIYSLYSGNVSLIAAIGINFDFGLHCIPTQGRIMVTVYLFPLTKFRGKCSQITCLIAVLFDPGLRWDDGDSGAWAGAILASACLIYTVFFFDRDGRLREV